MQYIAEKTATYGRRHTTITKGEVVVTMDISLSYVDLYRKCVARAENKNIEKIPPYGWLLLKFWPSAKTTSNVFQYTGHFKLKRMVQPRMLNKNNPDENYANPLLKFLKERAQTNKKPVTFVNGDAKCKVSIGEPGFPVTAVSRRIKVIVGVSKTMKVADHGFSRVSIMPELSLSMIYHCFKERLKNNSITA